MTTARAVMQRRLDEYAWEFDWATVPAEDWRAITLKGPWDFPIAAPFARAPIAEWSYPVPAHPAGLPEPKRCENRTWWSTAWRGPLMIHVGKNWDEDGEDDPRVRAMWRAVCPGLPLTRKAWTWAGHVTAVARLVDCHRSSPGCCPPWGAYATGRYAINHLILRDVRALTAPVGARGYQQLWTPHAGLVEQVRPMVPATGGAR